jgi:ribosomal protein S18 acetylase RimI-like enzyme
MLIERRAIALRDGTPGVVETYQPPFEFDLARSVASIWQDTFGSLEFCARRLLGEHVGYEETARDYLFVVRRAESKDEEAARSIVGTSWYVVGKDNPRIGLLGGVWAAPQVRRLGIASEATVATLAHFERQGGEAIYLGTVNPDALRIYERLGFTTYSGIVRRALVGGARDREETFDASYFRAAGPTSVREATWGDHPGISALYFAPNDTVLLDAPTGKFASRVSPQTSCVGHLPPIWESTVGRAGLLAVLETDDRRIVGTVALHRRAPPPVARRAILDFCLAPGVDRSDQLLDFALARAGRQGLTSLAAYVCDRDESKAVALVSAGFRHVATIPRALEVDGEELGLRVFQRG